MSYKTLLTALVAALAITGCATKGKPTPQAQLLTTEQIKTIDPSWNGKKVMIEGYPAFCGMMANVTLGKKSKMEIHTAPDCEGDKLIEANLMFGGNSVALSGEKERNFVTAAESFDNKTLKFTTDDYQELPTGKLKFSGTIICTGTDCYLDNITIHK